MAEQCPRAYQSWTAKETEMLKFIVESSVSDNDWSTVSKMMPGRSSKQCRDRWVNYIADGISKQKWSREEDKTIASFHALNGPKWSKLSRLLPGRTQLSIKNRWHSIFRSKLCHKKPPSLLHAYVKALRNGATPKQAFDETVGRMEPAVLGELSARQQPAVPSADCSLDPSMSGESESSNSGYSCSGALPFYTSDDLPCTTSATPLVASTNALIPTSPHPHFQLSTRPLPTSPPCTWFNLLQSAAPIIPTIPVPRQQHALLPTSAACRPLPQAQHTTSPSSATPLLHFPTPSHSSPNSAITSTLFKHLPTTFTPHNLLAHSVNSAPHTIPTLTQSASTTSPQQLSRPPGLRLAHALQQKVAHLSTQTAAASGAGPQQPPRAPRLPSAQALQKKAAYFSTMARIHLRAASAVHHFESSLPASLPPDSFSPTLTPVVPHSPTTCLRQAPSLPLPLACSTSALSSCATTPPPMAEHSWMEAAMQLPSQNWSAVAAQCNPNSLCTSTTSHWPAQHTSQGFRCGFQQMTGSSSTPMSPVPTNTSTTATGDLPEHHQLVPQEGATDNDGRTGMDILTSPAAGILAAGQVSQSRHMVLCPLPDLPMMSDTDASMPQLLSDAEFQALCSSLL